ncbi:MAG: hypothetical protein B7Z66_01210 [Chromatiales bacterium 21-64-14]|nr:MAG: hypothetical protein B7Z66_01210 [Chromatiales bacterium 21-64-14]HQU16010.1 YeeE/YedE family protein [Gammaproteobacteria bacterium]
MDHLSITHQVLLAVFLIAAVMGAVAYKTNFCTMGAVSDWVNMNDRGRLGAWLFAIVLAIVGVLILEGVGVAKFNSTLPPYRTANFAVLRYIVGGFLFGIGMTLGSGCSFRTMVRAGAGNVKSVMVLVMIGIFSYLMTQTVFYEKLFYGWVSATTVDLAARGIPNQDLGQIVGGVLRVGHGGALETWIGALVALVLLVVILRWADFRSRFDNILSGAVVGLGVVAAWYVTAGPMGRAWQDAVAFMDMPPKGVGAQSFTFVNPTGETLAYLMHPGNTRLVTFGVIALAGVVAGSLVYSVVTRKFRLEWFHSVTDFVRHMIGGALMGIGGVLGMGCTIGQGVTGVSTLALGSILAFLSIIFGSALTMKVEYYRLVYEQEASFLAALLSSLVDLRLLPRSLRRLEAI